MEINIHIHHHLPEKVEPEKIIKKCINCGGLGIASLEFYNKPNPIQMPLGAYGNVLVDQMERILIKEKTCPTCLGKGVTEHNL